MYLNYFAVRVPEGKSKRNGQVLLKHGQHYTIELANHRDVRCNAYVRVDGKDLGCYRVLPHRRVRLERSPSDRGRFTAYRISTSDAQAADLDQVNDDDLGLITVEFVPEVENDIYFAAPKGASHRTLESYSPAGTGLSGYSGQQFERADRITEDWTELTIIHLRIVVEDEDPRPLKSVHSTPIPPTA